MQAVALEFAQVVAKLVETVGFSERWKLGGRLDEFVWRSSRRACCRHAERTSNRRMMRVSWIFDSGIADRSRW